MTLQRDLSWFSKEITSITLRNLSSDLLSRDDLPSPKAEIVQFIDGVETRIWESQPAENTCNATWPLTGMNPAILKENLHIQEFTIRLTNTKDNSIVLQQSMNLDKLVDMGSIGSSKFSTLPTNSLFFRSDSDNYYYITESLHNALLGSGLLPAINRTIKDATDLGENSAESEQQRQDDEKELESCNNLESIEKELEELSHNQKIGFQADSEDYLRLQRIAALEMEVKQAESFLQEELAAEERELAALREISNLTDEIMKYDELSQEIIDINNQIRKKWEELQKAEFLLEAKQLKMLYELQHIYPIKLNESSDAYTIRGLELPSDLNQSRDDDILSSALGYVVHLLLLASKYLEIPLRYQLIFYASRSMIRDPIHGLNQAYPLFRKGTERERFDRAIVWLKKDIEQVLLTRGVGYDSSKDILYNLSQLFSCELCPALSF